MEYNVRLKYNEKEGFITLDTCSKENQWYEITIIKDHPYFEQLLKMYKLNPIK